MKKIANYIMKFEKFLIVFGMTCMVILYFVNVVARKLLPQTPFSFTEELTIIIFVWVTMFGISYGYKVHAHTVVDFIVNLFSRKCQIFSVFLSVLCSLVLMIIMTIMAYKTMINQIDFGQVTPGMELPMAVNSGALVVGSIFCNISIIISGIEDYSELRGEMNK